MYQKSSKDIPLININTFDDDHTQFNEGFLIKPFDSLQTLKHRATIDLIKICILEGKKIRPILITKIEDSTLSYQRLDGFCRYWAYKELGRCKIPCVFGTQKGGQSGVAPCEH